MPWPISWNIPAVMQAVRTEVISLRPEGEVGEKREEVKATFGMLMVVSRGIVMVSLEVEI
jgi:hypothetical protein